MTLDLLPIASKSLDFSYGLNAMHVAAFCVLMDAFGTAIFVCRARKVIGGSKVTDAPPPPPRTHAHSSNSVRYWEDVGVFFSSGRLVRVDLSGHGMCNSETYNERKKWSNRGGVLCTARSRVIIADAGEAIARQSEDGSCEGGAKLHFQRSLHSIL